MGALVVIWLTVLGNFRQQCETMMKKTIIRILIFLSLDFLYNSINKLSQEIKNCKSKVQNYCSEFGYPKY